MACIETMAGGNLKQSSKNVSPKSHCNSLPSRGSLNQSNKYVLNNFTTTVQPKEGAQGSPVRMATPIYMTIIIQPKEGAQGSPVRM